MAESHWVNLLYFFFKLIFVMLVLVMTLVHIMFLVVAVVAVVAMVLMCVFSLRESKSMSETLWNICAIFLLVTVHLVILGPGRVVWD